MDAFCRQSLQALVQSNAAQHGWQPDDPQTQGSTAQHSTAQHSTAQHLKNLIQALGCERCERHLCQLVIQAGCCCFGQLIQHCQAPQQASQFYRADSLQGTTIHTSLVMLHTTLTCAHKPGCLRCRIDRSGEIEELFDIRSEIADLCLKIADDERFNVRPLLL